MKKRILIINANPKSKSLCKTLSETYSNAAKHKNQVKVVHIQDLNFDADLQEGYDKIMPLEDDLIIFQQLLEWSQHIVIISPVWWGSMPAKFKGLIDRTFLSGFAFKYEKGKTVPKKLLRGRTSELIITLDTPPFWYKWVQRNIIYHQLKQTILSFSGIRNVSSHYFGPVISADKHRVSKWIEKTAQLAAKI